MANKRIHPLWVDGENWIDSISMGLGLTRYIDLRGENYSLNLDTLIETLRDNVYDSEYRNPNEIMVELIPTSIPKILVVDDESRTQNRLQRLFVNQGWEVVQARSNSQAMKALGENTFTVVTTDIYRQAQIDGEYGEFGFKLLKEMQEEYPDIPTVIISYDDHKDKFKRYALENPELRPWGAIDKESSADRIISDMKTIIDGNRLLNLPEGWSPNKE